MFKAASLTHIRIQTN